MAENIKSALHDATPSWNGFLYQGKVGLYVCLKLIVDKLQDNPSEELLNQFLESYSIEYEWIEDFSIKQNGTYRSLHQVKNKAASAFSNHISAIVTILNRKQKILSETDFVKYVNFNITNKDQSLSKIHSTFNLMERAGYINQSKQLVDDWQHIEVDIDDVDSDSLKKLLTDFHNFSENTFEGSKVYFHTAKSVSEPDKDIHRYSGMPALHHRAVNGLRSLSTLDIYLGFDQQRDFELVQSDTVLEQKLIELINIILTLVQPREEYLLDDQKTFLTALYEIIDKHIVSRHRNIRASFVDGEGFLEQREQLSFNTLFKVFALKLRNTNKKYWELNCRQIFEYAFIEHIESIELRIERNQNKQVSEEHLARLQQFRTDVLSKYASNFTYLLRLLFPHKVQNKVVDSIFYSSITEQSKIKEVFLSFIQKVDTEINELLLKPSKALAYHPTCIDISYGDEFDWANSIEKCRHAITENEYVRSFLGATHLVINANQAHNISEVLVELPTIVEKIDMDETMNVENKISNLSTLKFEKLDSAIEIINGN